MHTQGLFDLLPIRQITHYCVKVQKPNQFRLISDWYFSI